MNRDERIEMMVEVLNTAKEQDRNLVQFVDSGQPEHWVRVWDSLRGDPVHLDVTNRAIPGSPLPALTGKQIDALVALGVGPEARPDFTGTMQRPTFVEIAQRVEAIFEVLRSRPDFELEAGLGHDEWQPPNPALLDVYAGIERPPQGDAEPPGDPELLKRIEEAQSRYRKRKGEVLTVQPPYVVTCLDFGEEYCYWADEDAIMLRSISLAMQNGDLTGAQARAAYLPYREFQPDIYAAEYEEWNDWGFPLSTDDMDELAVCSITGEADKAGIEGVGVPWANLSPMSGIPLTVENDESLEQLRVHFKGRYAIVCTGGDGWWDLPPDEAQREIETARTDGAV